MQINLISIYYDNVVHLSRISHLKIMHWFELFNHIKSQCNTLKFVVVPKKNGKHSMGVKTVTVYK